MNQFTQNISPTELASNATIALENMDDFARMGGVIPTGPYAVIKRLIEAYALTITGQPCSVSLMGAAKTIDVEEAILALMRPTPGGVSREYSSKHFTYCLEGKEVHFNDELRAAVEKLLDCKLQEIALADFLLEVALEIPIEKIEVASNLLQAQMAI